MNESPSGKGIGRLLHHMWSTPSTPGPPFIHVWSPPMTEPNTVLGVADCHEIRDAALRDYEHEKGQP